RDPRHGREPAADRDREAVDALVADADERDAVDLGRVAAVGARRDRDLVLAWEVRIVGVPVEELRRLVHDRLRIEELAGADACDGAAGDVADGVAAAAGGRQPGGVEPVEDLRERAQLEPVELDVLPGRELAIAPAE